MFGEPQKLKDALKAYVDNLQALRAQPQAPDDYPTLVEQLQVRVKNIEDFLLSMHDAGF